MRNLLHLRTLEPIEKIKVTSPNILGKKTSQFSYTSSKASSCFRYEKIDEFSRENNKMSKN